MRPKLFRMASELKQNEEGMSEILRTNDSVLRVSDLYKSKMESFARSSGSEGAVGGASAIDTAKKIVPSGSASSTGGQGSSEEEGATSAQNGAAGGKSDVLIDLADLNFDTVPMTGSAEGAGGGAGVDLNSHFSLGSLMDDISALGKAMSRARASVQSQG